MVVTGQAVLYRIPKQFLPQPGQRLADFRHCLLRFNVTEQ